MFDESSHRLRFQLFCISAVVCPFIVCPIVVFRTVVLRTVGSFSFSLFQLINHWNLITENWVCASRFRISFQIWFGFFNFERFDFNWLMVEQAKVKMLIVQWEGAAFRERKRNLISRPLRIIIISLNAKQEHLPTNCYQ